jgi:hypothetical protein
VNKVSLVGLFEVERKTPCHNILVEFFNNWKLDFEHNRIKVMMVEEQKITYRHLLVEILKISHTIETKVNHVEMLDTRVALVDKVDRILHIYDTDEGGL